MSKLFSILFVGVLLSMSCNPNDGKNSKEDVTDEDETSSKLSKAASEACECMSSFTESLNPKTQKIIIKAAKSGNMEETFKEEIMKIEDEEVQKVIMNDMNTISNMGENVEMKDCVEGVKKKYKLKKNDEEQQAALLKAFKNQDGCEVTAAFMKIGFDQNSKKKSTEDETTSDEKTPSDDDQ